MQVDQYTLWGTRVQRASPILGSVNGRRSVPLWIGRRKVVMRRFPCSVIYRVEDDTVFVLAFAYHRRTPRYWRDEGTA
jgi:hypothetical protein